MIYLFSFLALTLNPFIWKAKYNQKKFLLSQLFRLVIGFLLMLFISYFILVDHTGSAFISYGLFCLSFFLMADLFYSETVKGSFYTPLIGLLFLLSSIYLAFIYPLTLSKAKYEFADSKAKVVSKEKISMDEKHIPVVPESYARYRSEKLLGELSHSAYFDLGDSTIQKIDGTLYWVTPIEYTGFFKWIKSSTVPGYIKMSAEDENADAQLIKKPMKYVPSAYFGKELERHVRSIHKNAILLDPSFEPDDKGKPYYVVPYGYYNKFRNIVDVKGVYLVDPLTGKVQDYKMGTIPAFIDQVIPASVAEDWNEWYGKYIHGFWNAHISQEDVKLPTAWEGLDEVNGVFNPKLELSWFTDYTRPKTGSGSMVGYSVMDARTGHFTFYTEANGSLNGKAAMNVAEKTFRANKYAAGTPTLYMIYGQFTWVVPVMDTNHVLREMMLINAKDEKIYSADDSKRNLFDGYKYVLATKMGNDKSVPSNIANEKSMSGIVTHVYKAEKDNFTLIKFMIKGSDKIFQITSTDYPYSVFIETGIQVKIKYIDTDEVISSVNSFTMQE